ncbi:alpha-L-rhamnosidase [Sphaerisporangium rufum]|uniref:alpha-L-rhamnosidase n=1 Tax=Sphaerisporangium rufum TaxID=1381558 RepID=A0A919R0A4_9ACTN|nr:glycoside hydrolase family 78 protein [Sphaerisporangium rufum]GII76998.1 alpha-L-rhamnosidase [Sphaerisporangium rufum]
MRHSRQAIVVDRVRAEHHDHALGIGEARPRLSWRIATDLPHWRQDSYQIEVADPATAVTMTTGRVRSAESVLVPWPAEPLASRARRLVRVRVWGADDGVPTPWSAPLQLEAGLLAAGDWSAAFITPERPADSAPLLRHEFAIDRRVVSARLYASALGLYELELNGRRVADHTFTPGWTSYPHRLRYQTFDVTRTLRRGRNALGGWLADGWYRGRLGFGGGTRNIYGDTIALLAQLEIVHDGGGTTRVVTGTGWRAAPGPVRSAEIYDGEHHDARLEPAGWSEPGFDDAAWRPVRTVPRDLATLVAPTGPPVRCTQELSPVADLLAPSGRTIVDFGQNLAGRLRVTVTGPAGSRVRLRHAEVLQDGELCVHPLRTAKATDEYVLGDGGEQVWEPRFTYHGFRYAEIDGDADVTGMAARVYHTDMRRIGAFHCSDPLVERLHENVVWSMRGNFVDVPTDCPQRDERLGWTGDLQIFLPAAAYLYDCAGMLRSWLRDLSAEQFPDGTVPLFTPLVPVRGWSTPRPAAAWGDAAVLVPWELYRRFGDAGVLRDQYAGARAWVDRVAALAGEDHLWTSDGQLGDWLDPSAPPDDPAAAKADPHLVATAYHARSAAVLARIAAVLGRHEDHARYDALARAVAAAFRRRWMRPSGLLSDDAQTSYALALRFGLISGDERRDRAGRRLAELVGENGHRIATGFVGTPVICDALTDTGHLDTAYALLTQRRCPSWLYPVTAGATTIWERWDGVLPGGRVNTSKTTSFNHYALGAVADWLHRTVAGLAPAEPGYRRLLVRPRPGGGLTHAATSHETPYGRAAVSWRRDGVTMTVEVEVPPGTTATVELPESPRVSVGSGHHRWRLPHR